MVTVLVTIDNFGRMTRVTRDTSISDMKNASTEELLGAAKNVVERTAANSTVFDPKREERIPKFHAREVVTGHILGRGGFCVVRDVDKIRNGLNPSGSSQSLGSLGSRTNGFFRLFRNKDASDDERSVNSAAMSDRGDAGADDMKARREFIVASSKKKRGRKYVVKSVSSDVDKITYMKGNVDIAIEAKFLAALDHTNIIKLVGCSTRQPCDRGYFLILERMSATLSKKIKGWMDKDRLNKGITGCFVGSSKKDLELYTERIEAAYDIANAMHYLHTKNIIFRDLKPDNVGFDRKNVLKLFDFGLAKELPKKDRTEDGVYKNLTAVTGAIRYMAPEVGLGQPYNLSADVYSWAMVMWFMLALEPPFGFYSEDMIIDRVFRRGSRPAIFKAWNEMIGELLQAAWDTDLSKRPSFLEVSLCLKQELVDCDGGTVGTNSVVSGEDRHQQ